MTEQTIDMQAQPFNLEGMKAVAILANNTSIPDGDNKTPTRLIGHDPTWKAFVKRIKDSSTKISIAANYEADIVQLINLKKTDVGKMFC